MKDIYHIDFETYSGADLRSFGAYRYACDESTEILIMAIAKNDEEPLLWSKLSKCESLLDFGTGAAVEMLEEAIKSEAAIYAHNAQFEAAICKYLLEKTFGIKAPKLTQWRCTAAMARRAAIPSSLSGAGEFLDIEETKDKSGAALIRKFSIPRRPTKKDPRIRILPEDEPEAFKEFIDYCKQDVMAEKEIHKKISAFELEGAVLDSFQFDLEMNDRGVPVNVPALKRVNQLINEYTDRLTAEFSEITGFRPTQRAKVLEWSQERGYPFEDLKAAQVDHVLNNGPSGWDCRRNISTNNEKTILKTLPVEMSHEAFKALKIRSNIAYAAVKKVPTMLGAACPDAMVRGSLMWSGAERTHRWAGRIIQPQNFRRPTIKGTEQAYKMLCNGADIETIEMLFGPFLEVVASCIRHFIHWPGGKLNQADFSSVEARGAAWLCGAEKTLKLFRDNVPLYERMASLIFGVPIEEVTEEMRFIGKQAVLGCTYNMGRPKFRGTCEAYNFKPSPSMVGAFKTRWFKMVKRAEKLCQNPEPWGEREIKFPQFQWMQPRNLVKNKKFVGRGFTIWAYRQDGTRRAIQDWHNPTDKEWADLTYDDLADRAVTTWREDNPEIVDAWKSLDKAAKDAIRNPGKVFKGTDKISLGVTEKPGFRALVMKLPSGHLLVYPKAKLVWNGEKGSEINWSDNYNTEIYFWGKIPMKSKWGWCKTYGGKLLENATQGICGDFMANGAVVASQNGYDAFMLVHDELIGPQYLGQDHETLCKHLCTLPPWAAGMPLAAEGDTIPFYKK